MTTQLLYMKDMDLLSCNASVEYVTQKEGKTILVLDQTVFYPQGGGQPYDTGTISNDDSKYIVEEVRYENGEVLHIGHFDGPPFIQGEEVTCQVDKERRELNARLHSGGHIIDMAVTRLGYDWIPGKGYHFPDGPYVEYATKAGVSDPENVAREIEKVIATIQQENPQVEVRLSTKEELAKLCRFVPDYLPKDKPARVVMYGDFGVPCGGIHVNSLKDIGVLKIRKVKARPNLIKLSYEIS